MRYALHVLVDACAEAVCGFLAGHEVIEDGNKLPKHDVHQR